MAGNDRRTRYSDFISEAIGVTDPEVLFEVEDIMRRDIFHSTLDWQTKEQLEAAAREAYGDVLAFREEG